MPQTRISYDNPDDVLQVAYQRNFSRGVVNSPSPTGLKEGEVYDALNASIRDPDEMGMRDGRIKFGLTLPGVPQALEYWSASDGSTPTLIAVVAGKIYKSTGGAWTQVGVLVLSNTTTRCQLQYYNGSLYIFSGSNSDHVWAYDGTGVLVDCGDPTVTPNLPQGLITVVAHDRMFIFDKDFSYFTNELTINVPRATNVHRITSGYAEVITSARALRQDQILIGKARSIYIYPIAGDPTTWKADIISDTINSLSVFAMTRTPNSVMWMANGVIYEAEEQQYAYVRITPKVVSEDVEKYMKSINYLIPPVMTYFNDFLLCSVTFLDGNKYVLAYDWRRKGWAGRWTWKPKFWCQGMLNGEYSLFMVDNAGTQVYQGFKSTQDDGSYFNFSVLTRGMMFNEEDPSAAVLDKTTRSHSHIFRGTFGDTSISVVDDNEMSYVVDTISTPGSPPLWGALVWPFSWGSVTPTKRRKPIYPRRSTYWQIRIDHSNGRIAVQSSALTAFIEQMRLE